MEKKLQKTYVTYYNLLIAGNFWQAHYLVNNLSEGIHETKCQLVELHKKHATIFWNTQTLKKIS